ncbi:transcription elongation factor Elf1 like-domain-containing protein [Chlamydoabsidia padenii]|nr:transcription elongation factor Elf1 like-domain-containing protein [Chlamydoabsidia padenii]
MGKRKVKRKAAKKMKDKLDTQFNCLFCNHEKSIECKMDQANKVGHLTCKVCDINWQCSITYLDEPVDVYSAWVDACEEVNKAKKLAAAAKARNDNSQQDHGNQYEDDDEDDDED